MAAFVEIVRQNDSSVDGKVSSPEKDISFGFGDPVWYKGVKTSCRLINEAYCEDYNFVNGHHYFMGWLFTNFYVSKQPYLVGGYGLLMDGIGLMQFPTCPQEALLLLQDIIEAKGYLKPRGILHVGVS